MSYGRVVVTELPDDEVQIVHPHGVLFMKRRSDEEWVDFVGRVVAWVEKHF